MIDDANDGASLAAIYQGVATVPTNFQYQSFTENIPKILQTDIDRGTIQRYFTRQANHKSGYITEINKSDFLKLKSNHFYTTVEMTWRIAGELDDRFGVQVGNTPIRTYTGVTTANRISLEDADKILPGMKSRVINLNQFYQFT